MAQTGATWIEFLLVEPNTYFFLFLVIAFLGLTFDARVQTVYGMLLAADFVFWIAYKENFNYSTLGSNTLEALVWGGVAYVIFYFVTFYVVGFLQASAIPNYAAFNKHLQSALLGAAVDVPVFAGNKFVTFIVYGIVIPIIETRTLVGRLVDFLAKITHTSLVFAFNKTVLPTLAVALVTGLIAAWFHIQAKGVGANVDLFIVFLFFAASALLVVYKREMKSAIFLHIINNSRTVLEKFGYSL